MRRARSWRLDLIGVATLGDAECLFALFELGEEVATLRRDLIITLGDRVRELLNRLQSVLLLPGQSNQIRLDRAEVLLVQSELLSGLRLLLTSGLKSLTI